MNRPAFLALALVSAALAACSGAPAAKGVIPPGTPPPDYEIPRGYTPTPAADPATPAAIPTSAPNQGAPAIPPDAE